MANVCKQAHFHGKVPGHQGPSNHLPPCRWAAEIREPCAWTQWLYSSQPLALLGLLDWRADPGRLMSLSQLPVSTVCPYPRREDKDSCSEVNPILNNLDNSDLKFKSLDSCILIAWQKTIDQKKEIQSMLPLWFLNSWVEAGGLGTRGLSYTGRSCL